MIAVSESTQVDVAAAELWGVVQDYALDVRWRTGLVEMTPNPPGSPAVGSTIHEVTRTAGRTYVTDTVIESVGPDYQYRFSGSGDSGRVSGGRTVIAITDGSAEFTYDVELGLSGVLRLAKPLVRTMMGRTLRRDLATLKRLIEEGELTPSPPAEG